MTLIRRFCAWTLWMAVMAAMAPAQVWSPQGSPEEAAPAPQPPQDQGTPSPPQTQTTPPPQDEAPPPPSAAEAPPSLPVAEAVRLARAALEAVDAGGDARALLTETVEYVRVIQAGEPNHPWLPYITGRVRLLTGQRVDGIRELQAFTRSPQGRMEWKAFAVLGDALVEEFPALAEAEYRKALALNDRSPAVHLGLSRTARKQGRAAEALEEAQAALRLEGGVTVGNLAFLAELLRAMGQIENAAAVSKRAVEAARTQRQARPGDAVALQTAQAQIQLYMVILRDWINANPQDAGAYLAFSRVGEELGEVERMIQCHNAIAALEQGIERLGTDAAMSLKLERARLLAGAGRGEEAALAYEAILQTDPDNSAAQAGLEALRGGQ